MNNNIVMKRIFCAVISVISAVLLISPVDLLTGMQIDDIVYLATTIATTGWQVYSFLEKKKVSIQGSK